MEYCNTACKISKHCYFWSPVIFELCINAVSCCCFQIAELKRGAEIIVCTPGRMIDMLGANSGEFILDDPLISLF